MLSLKQNTEKLFHVICNCHRNISCSSWLSLTHYDVLNVKRNSSQKEIRDAYIELCKENHPDCDEKDPSLHKKFVRINEAYKVLSKPKSRRRYDETIAYLYDQKQKSALPKDIYDTDDYRSVYGDRSFYHNRKEEFMNEDPVPDDKYYGIKGIKRVSNATLLVILLAISLVSGFVQIFTIKNSMMASEYRKISEENARLLSNIKKKNAAQSEEEFLEDLEKSYNENLSKLDPRYVEEDLD